MAVLPVGISSAAAAEAGYQIERSVRFNSADSAYLNRTPAVVGNRKTWTWSGWIKRSGIATGAYQNLFCANSGSAFTGIRFYDTTNVLQIFEYTGSAFNYNLQPTQVFSDPSAWYHIVVAVDTTQATSSNRIKLYVNGSQVTAFGTSTYPSQNFDGLVNSNNAHEIGRTFSNSSGNEYYSGYMADIHFIDGQALTPSDFGEYDTTTGVWKPKEYEGTFGTNGFRLPFANNASAAALGQTLDNLSTDPLWNQTTLLLNGNGANTATNNQFVDSSTNAFSITRNGNTTQGTFSPFSQTGWSNYFDGSDDYMTLPASSSWLFNGDACLEVWVYWTASQASIFFATGNASSSDQFGLFPGGEGIWWGVTAQSSSVVPPLNQWSHICVTRQGSTIRRYLNGVLVTTATNASAIGTNSSVAYIGRRPSGGLQLPGYISQLRIINGSVPTTYQTSSTTIGDKIFSPPTTPLTTTSQGATANDVKLLMCQSNRFLDVSNSNVAVTVYNGPSVQAFSPFAPTAAYSAATNGGSGYFDGTGDYLTVPHNAAFDFGSGDFTMEAWVYPTTASLTSELFDKRASAANYSQMPQIQITANQPIAYASATGSSWAVSISGSSNVNPYSWNHVALTRSGSTWTLWLNGASIGTATSSITVYASTSNVVIGAADAAGTNPMNGYIAGSRIVKGTAVYTSAFTPPTAPLTAISGTSLLLNYTNAGITDATAKNDLETVGNAQISTTQSKFGNSSIYLDGSDNIIIPNNEYFNIRDGNYTIELWYYPSSLTVANSHILDFGDGLTSGQNSWNVGFFGASNTNKLGFIWTYNGSTENKIEDSASMSTGQWYHIAVVKNGTSLVLYKNGTSVASTTLSGGIATSNRPLILGSNSSLTGGYANGYIDDLRITKAARYTGNFTVPDAQFAYNKRDINYKQWAVNNISVSAGVGNDSLVDTPTPYGTDTGAGGEVRGNYATWNPLAKGSDATLANGNLDVSFGTAGSTTQQSATFGMTTGKWYWEATITASSASPTFAVVGITTKQFGDSEYPGYTATSWGYRGSDGQKWNNTSGSSYGASYTTNDVIGIAFDADAGTLTFYKNGVSQGTAYSSLAAGTYFPAIGDQSSSNTFTAATNFGQRPFAYTAPSGFKALCTQNLPAPTVVQGDDYFLAGLYTGTGSSSPLAVNGPPNPDLVWIKARSQAYSHSLLDRLRDATDPFSMRLYSNSTNAEYDYGSSLLSTTSTGFNLTTTDGDHNSNGVTYVAWQWKANGAGVSNTQGTITSTVSANTTAGFSVVKFTYPSSGSFTVGHGLGVAPSMIITKHTNRSSDWFVYHSAATNNGQYLNLNTTGAVGSASNFWGTANPTSTVFGGTVNTSGLSGDTDVAYCFAPVVGFSAFGSYTGNGSTDGPFIYTGFRPAFVIFKNASASSYNWVIYDSKRSTYNQTSAYINPNTADLEYTDVSVDMLSNGLKIRGTWSGYNGNGNTIIYMAFAENPFKHALAR